MKFGSVIRIGWNMKKLVTAMAFIASFAFIAVAQAEQVRFYTRGQSGVVPAQDVHYTIMDLSGNKVAEETLEHADGVTINNIPVGVYFLSAEQPSTGYFGSRTIEIKENDEDRERELVLGPDGLKDYNPNYAQAPVAQPAPANTVAPNTAPVQGNPIPAPTSSNVGIGRWAWALGIAGIACGIVGIVEPDDNNRPVSNFVD